MLPLILVTKNKDAASSYIANSAKRMDVLPSHVNNIVSEKKGFGLGLVQELKKDIAFSVTKTTMYILWDFDTASWEAQNAALKLLEEHSHLIFFIIHVKEPNRLLPTIVSRSKTIVLKKESEGVISGVLTKKLEMFLTDGRIDVLADASFDVKNYKEPQELYDGILEFFRSRLASDLQSTIIIDEILKSRYMALYNNVPPQQGIDQLLLFIRRKYRIAKHIEKHFNGT